MSALFPGYRLFQLRDTHGLPLGFAIDRIVNDAGLTIEWPSFIEEARKDRWDYQTYTDLEHALVDAYVPLAMRAGILDRFKLYVLKYPHAGKVRGRIRADA